MAAAFLWLQVFGGPDGKLHVHFFDVGQRDSILIVTPDGRQVLVDGGPGAESATFALAGAVPDGDRSLDLLVLTHLDADHSRGLFKVLEQYQAGAVLVGREDPEAALYSQWRAGIYRSGSGALTVHDGYVIDLGSGANIEVLNPSPTALASRIPASNDDSVVLRLSYGSISFLLPGDIEVPAETRLFRADNASRLKSTVLKVDHHGSKTSTTEAFLQAVDPSLAVVSVGGNNSFGHPNPEVLDRLALTVGEAGIYRTDQDGWVEFVTDGQGLWAKTAL